MKRVFGIKFSPKSDSELKNSTYECGMPVFSDEKTFYSLFLGSDIIYQILGNFNGNVIKDLLNQLNELKNEPKFMDFLNVFNNVLTNNKIQYFVSSISAIKDFELTSSFQLNIKDKKKIYIKEKNN